MRVLSRCLVPLTGLPLAVTILLSSLHSAHHFQTLANQRFFARPFAYPGSAAAHIPGDPNSLFDPVLVYSTFLGGPDTSSSVALVDILGNIYIGGTGTIQVTPGAVQPSNCQTCEGFLSKLNSSGQLLVFSTYIQGVRVTALAIDGAENIYVAGQVPPATISGIVSAPILPIPSQATPFQPSPKGKNVGILKLNSAGTSILAATYLGGSGAEEVGGLAVDSSNNVYVVGTTVSNDFPTSRNALQSSLGSGGQNIFVTKLDANLSTAIYSTYLGANSTSTVGISSDDTVPPSMLALMEGSGAIAVDASTNVYITGEANAGFPITTGAVQAACPTSSCPVVAKLDPVGSTLLYATYLASRSAQARAYSVAVDASQNIYVGGSTGSGYPEVNALQPCTLSNGYLAGFISKIDAAGALTFSTCLGNNNGAVLDLVLDRAQNLDIVGYGNNVLLQNPIQTNANLFTAAYVASLNINGSPPSLLFSSYIGSGNEAESFGSVGVDASGNIYAAGTVYDGLENFPVFNALQSVPAPSNQSAETAAFVIKIAPTNAAAAALSPAALVFPAQQVGTSSSPQEATISDLGSAGLSVSNVNASGDFSVQNNCVTTVSPAGGTCQLPVIFTPTAIGTRHGTLTITDDSAGSPHTVPLTGQGGQPTVILSPSNLAFSNQALGTASPPQTVTLTNGGTSALQVSHIQVSGPLLGEQHLWKFGRTGAILSNKRDLCSHSFWHSQWHADDHRQRIEQSANRRTHRYRLSFFVGVNLILSDGERRADRFIQFDRACGNRLFRCS